MGSCRSPHSRLSSPPTRPCQASVIRAIHHPPWGGGSLLSSNNTASSSIFNQPGERGEGEPGRGRWSQRAAPYPSQPSSTCLVSGLKTQARALWRELGRRGIVEIVMAVMMVVTGTMVTVGMLMMVMMVMLMAMMVVTVTCYP